MRLGLFTTAADRFVDLDNRRQRVVLVEDVLNGGQRHATGLEQEHERAQGPGRVDGAEHQEHHILTVEVGDVQVHFVSAERTQ